MTVTTAMRTKAEFLLVIRRRLCGCIVAAATPGTEVARELARVFGASPEFRVVPRIGRLPVVRCPHTGSPYYVATPDTRGPITVKTNDATAERVRPSGPFCPGGTRLEKKIARVDARIAAGHTHLVDHRASLVRQLGGDH